MEAWKNGQGAFFDLLSEQVQWTLAGRSPVSGVYTSREEFLKKSIAPITQRLQTAITPTSVDLILAKGNQVILVWQGEVTAKNGDSYKNTYCWNMTFENDSIIKATAFLDTYELVRLLNNEANGTTRN